MLKISYFAIDITCALSTRTTWKRAVILSCISPKIIISMTYRNSALDVWNNLRERFSQGNGPRVFQLQKDLSGIVVFVS